MSSLLAAAFSTNSVMAAGRGEFFRSFLEGLDRKPAQPAPVRRQPVRGRGKPGPGRGQAGPWEGPGGGKRRSKRRPKAAPSPDHR